MYQKRRGLICLRVRRSRRRILTKLISSTSFASPKCVLWAIVACALEYALFFPGATSPALAAGGSDDEVLLVDGKLSRQGLYQFSFATRAGQTYPIGMSVDLVNWSLLTNVVGGGGPLLFTDLDAPKSRQRFYRVGVPTTLANLVFVGPGTFTMGSPESEEGHASTEGPQTVVTLTRGFWMGKYEVSQEEYVAVIGNNVAWYNYDLKLPVELVSWFLATNYCGQLTERERAGGWLPAGYVYRLPTEAEWEYACRAGRTTPFGIGDGTSLSSTQANFDGTFPYGGAAPGQYLNKTTRPGSYQPNAWGIYDMHGNVWEWCQDWFGSYPGGNVTDPRGPASGSERVVRGGGYPSLGQGCRSAERDSRRPGYKSVFYGFRVVLAPNP